MSAFSNWLNSVNGRAIEMDSSYGAQCWDLWSHYAVNMIGVTYWRTGTNGGTWSRTRPEAPAHGVQVGYVVSPSNGNNGVIFVHVQNGYELNELHDVNITNPQLGDVLKFNGTFWINQQP